MLSVQPSATPFLRVPNIGLEMRLKVVSPPLTITRLTRKLDEGRRFYERRGVNTYAALLHQNNAAYPMIVTFSTL
jgi:hypothetical protein